MKNRVFLASVTAVCGFALGWVLKPAQRPETLAKEAEVDTAGHRSERLSEAELDAANREREPHITSSSGDSLSEETEEDPKAFAIRMERAFKDATFQRDRGKLLRLAEALGLTNEQVAQLEAMLLQQRRAASPLGTPSANRNPKETLDTLIRSAKEMDDQFRSTLTPEQDKALEALRARQRENQTETRAQKELTELTSRLDLTPDQRDAALQVLRTQSAKTQEKFPAGSDLVSESSLLPLVAAGQFSANSVEAMTLLAVDPPASNDSRGTMDKLNEIQLKQLQERLTGLSSVLTPAQLDQYRASMETNHLSRQRVRTE
ncbi:MAG TPA: hypothetical protein VIM57_03890 [Luteolibacter sp.]